MTDRTSSNDKNYKSINYKNCKQINLPANRLKYKITIVISVESNEYLMYSSVKKPVILRQCDFISKKCNKTEIFLKLHFINIFILSR